MEDARRRSFITGNLRSSLPIRKSTHNRTSDIVCDVCESWTMQISARCFACSRINNAQVCASVRTAQGKKADRDLAFLGAAPAVARTQKLPRDTPPVARANYPSRHLASHFHAKERAKETIISVSSGMRTGRGIIAKSRNRILRHTGNVQVVLVDTARTGSRISMSRTRGQVAHEIYARKILPVTFPVPRVATENSTRPRLRGRDRLE